MRRSPSRPPAGGKSPAFAGTVLALAGAALGSIWYAPEKSAQALSQPAGTSRSRAADRVVAVDPLPPTALVSSRPMPLARPGQAAVFYANCTEARAAGAAPIDAGDAGYRPGLDRDGDGKACEPYRGR